MSRKLDLSAFAGDDEEEEAAVFQPKALALNQLKSKTFSHGITKKSKKDLERETEERKKRDEEEALAKLNAELESSESVHSGGMFAFGPGGSMGMGRGRPTSGFVRAGGGVYETAKPPGPPTGPSSMPPRGPAAMGYKPFRPKESSPPPSAAPKAKGKRAMDSFLLEIKTNQEARESRLGQAAKLEGSSVTALAAWENNPAARAAAGAQIESTNLFVTNLPSNVNEENLGVFFAKYGPIGTVKIMWPRTEDEIAAARKGRGNLTGFVNYMTREDAANALNELDGLEWGGNQIRVAWGKPMPLPAKPIHDLGTGSSKKRGRSPSPSRERSRQDIHASRSRARSRSVSAGSAFPPRRSRPRSQSRSRSRARSDSSGSSRSRSHSAPPCKLSSRDVWLDKIKAEQEAFVKAVAKRIKDHGKGLEDVLRQKEKDNPKFAFLFNEELPEYHLYKYSLDSRYRFPTPPSDHFDDSGYASLYSSDSAEDSEKERTTKGKLGRLARKRFEAMLRALSGKRGEIARAMEFALKRAEAADEVADIVCKSLMCSDTPIPRKVARLHLVSDILHNSASPLPNVWRYRLAFEKRLPPVFAHLATVQQSLLAYSGKISADSYKAQIMVVLNIWEAWIVYTQETSQTLRALLDGEVTLADMEAAKSGAAARPAPTDSADQRPVGDEPGLGKGFKKAGGFKSSFKRVDPAQEAEDLLRETLGARTTQEEDHLDGEPMDDDLDGEPMDLDGEPMADDLDGEPM